MRAFLSRHKLSYWVVDDIAFRTTRLPARGVSLPHRPFKNGLGFSMSEFLLLGHRNVLSPNSMGLTLPLSI